MPKISVPARVELLRRGVPYMLFLMPILASVAITACHDPAATERIFNITYPVFIAAGILAVDLIMEGLGIFQPKDM